MRQQSAAADGTAIYKSHKNMSAPLENLPHRISQQESFRFLNREVLANPIFVECAKRDFIARLKRTELNIDHQRVHKPSLKPPQQYVQYLVH
jgi:hypothetical protein